MLKRVRKHFHLSELIKAIVVALIIIDIKIFLQYFEVEILSLSPLFAAIVSGNIFILGFLLNSTLADYKEAEKLPGEIASSLESIYDECEIIYRKSRSDIAKESIQYISQLTSAIIKWFQKEEYTKDVMAKISGFNAISVKLEDLTVPNYLVRIKSEQNNIRRYMNRVNVIRDTPFYTAAYKTAVITVVMMLVGLMLVKSEDFYTSIFFVGVLSFLNVYMLVLIRDLDDPFEYKGKTEINDEVSLKPIHDLHIRINHRFNDLIVRK